MSTRTIPCIFFFLWYVCVCESVCHFILSSLLLSNFYNYSFQMNDKIYNTHTHTNTQKYYFKEKRHTCMDFHFYSLYLMNERKNYKRIVYSGYYQNNYNNKSLRIFFLFFYIGIYLLIVFQVPATLQLILSRIFCIVFNYVFYARILENEIVHHLCLI